MNVYPMGSSSRQTAIRRESSKEESSLKNYKKTGRIEQTTENSICFCRVSRLRTRAATDRNIRMYVHTYVHLCDSVRSCHDTRLV